MIHLMLRRIPLARTIFVAAMGFMGVGKPVITATPPSPSPSASREASVISKTVNRVSSSASKSPENTAVIDLGDGVQMEFVLLNPGSFVMGAQQEGDSDGDATPLRKVTLTEPFYIGKYEVTQEQWEKMMGNNPSCFKGIKNPVDSVSWDACQVFLAKLQERTGQKFALPSEAQWEFTCRAGTTTPWSFGEAEAEMKAFVWSGGNSSQTTHPVGQKKPNAWGLYDMHGNVAEWCADWYSKHIYARGDVTNSYGPTSGFSRVLRGGAWGDSSEYLRSAYRNCNGPDGAHDGIGLRCVMLIDASSSLIRPE